MSARERLSVGALKAKRVLSWVVPTALATAILLPNSATAQKLRSNSGHFRASGTHVASYPRSVSVGSFSNYTPWFPLPRASAYGATSGSIVAPGATYGGYDPYRSLGPRSGPAVYGTRPFLSRGSADPVYVEGTQESDGGPDDVPFFAAKELYETATPDPAGSQLAVRLVSTKRIVFRFPAWRFGMASGEPVPENPTHLPPRDLPHSNQMPLSPGSIRLPCSG
jgi:hypothetical protein